MRSHRPRRLAVVAAALLLGVPVLWGSGAQAESADSVTFTGGCTLDLLGPLGSADSNPGQASIPAGSELRFVNELGKRATLSLDGEPAVELPSGGSAGVVFHQGPVTATMQVSCLLGTVSGNATVEVIVPEAPAAPEPTSPPAGDSSSGPAQGGGGEPPGSSADGSGSSADAGPSRSGPGGSAPSVPQAPQGPTPSGGQPTDPGASDVLTPRWDVRGQPGDSGDAQSSADTVDTTPGGGDDPETEQLAQAVGPGSGDGPNGMLALVATVCVAGVAAGAVRAIVAQRSSRAEWA